MGMELDKAGPIELSPKSEHFVAQTKIDGDKVTVVCSCGESFGPKDSETNARKGYDKHYKKVM